MFEDFETAIAADGRATRRYCAFGQWVRTLEPADQVFAENLVHDGAYNCRQLARYFRSKGAKVNDQVLNRHRNGTCCGQRKG